MYEKLSTDELELLATKNPKDKAALLVELGGRLIRSAPRRSEELARKALSIARRSGNREMTGKALHLEASAGFYRMDYSEVIRKLDTALAIFSELDDAFMKARVNHALATAHSEAGMNDSAKLLFGENLRYFTGTGNEHWIARTLSHLATAHTKTSDYAGALHYELRALAIWSKARSLQDLGLIHNNIGSTYHRVGDPEKALFHFMQALDFRISTNDRVGEAITRQNIADVNIDMKNYDEAWKSLKHAYSILCEFGLDERRADSLHSMGVIHERTEEYEQALEYYREALRIAENADFVEVRERLLYNIGAVYRKKQEYEEALRYLRTSLSLTRKTGNRQLECELNREISLVYESTGNITEAFSFYKLYSDTKEELIEQGSRRTLSEIATSYMEPEAPPVDDYVREESMRVAMKHRVQELTTTALHLVQKNEFLEQLSKEVTQILRSQNKVKRSDSLRNLLKRIQQNIDSESNWHVFEEQFERIYDNYLSKLAERFPALSPTELKVCALLKINFSSKEIAGLLCLSVRTVDCHRHNIRKKLGISPETNLSALLSSSQTFSQQRLTKSLRSF